MVFHLPVARHFFHWLGAIDAGSASLSAKLAAGKSIGLASGGIAELFETSDAHEIAVLKARKGFVRQAIIAGAPLLPVYLFGNTTAIACVTDPWGILARISRKLRASLTWFWGRCGLPIPHRTPIVAVMGEPLRVPKDAAPSPELVDAWHAKFLQAQQNLFETHKASYGWGHKELIVK